MAQYDLDLDRIDLDCLFHGVLQDGDEITDLEDWASLLGHPATMMTTGEWQPTTVPTPASTTPTATPTTPHSVLSPPSSSEVSLSEATPLTLLSSAGDVVLADEDFLFDWSYVAPDEEVLLEGCLRNHLEDEEQLQSGVISEPGPVGVPPSTLFVSSQPHADSTTAGSLMAPMSIPMPVLTTSTPTQPAPVPAVIEVHHAADMFARCSPFMALSELQPLDDDDEKKEEGFFEILTREDDPDYNDDEEETQEADYVLQHTKKRKRIRKTCTDSKRPYKKAHSTPKRKRRRRDADKHAQHLSVIGHCCNTSHSLYLYNAMPEQTPCTGETKYIWVCFYCEHIHSPADATLHLLSEYEAPEPIPADLEHSWMTSKVVEVEQVSKRMVQHKWCFPCPQTTFNRQIFDAELQFSSTTYEDTADFSKATYQQDENKEMKAMLLGALSFVSTTSQRKKFWPHIKERHMDEARLQVIVNLIEHPASRRHFPNGKGSGQNSRNKTRFMMDEFEKAVQIDIRPVSK